MASHAETVVSIDACHELDLYASATRRECVLRTMSTNCYFRTVFLSLPSKPDSKVFRVLLSSRGYVVVQARSGFTMYGRDTFVVYSVNGERVAMKELDELVNAVLFDQYKYFIVSVWKRVDYGWEWQAAKEVLHRQHGGRLELFR